MPDAGTHRDSLSGDAHELSLDEAQLLGVIREALLEFYSSQKSAALSFGVLEQQLSRQLRGESPFPVTLLARESRLLEAFAMRLARHVGLSVRLQDAAERRMEEMCALQARLNQLINEEATERRVRAAVRSVVG